MFPVFLREATGFCVSNHCRYKKHRIVAGNLIDLRVEKFKQKGDKQAEACTFLAMFDQDSAIVDQLCNCFFLWCQQWISAQRGFKKNIGRIGL